MKILFADGNYAVADPLDDGISQIELVSHMGSDLSAVRAARVSFQGDRIVESLGEDEKKLIDYLLRNEHMTPFEHNAMTFHIVCPIYVARQWMRHRIGCSYNEVSRRYTSENLQFYVPKPDQWREQGDTSRQASKESSTKHAYSTAVAQAQAQLAVLSYEAMLDRGIAREQARMILPMSMYTRFYTTMNLRALMHFYSLRATEHAQYEIRRYAYALGIIASSLFPVAWESFFNRFLQSHDLTVKTFRAKIE